VQLLDALRARRFGSLALSAACIASCALLVQAVPARVDRTRASGLWEMGVYAVKHHDARAAVDWFRRSIAEKPRLPTTHKDLALALLSLGENQEAESELRRALALD